MVDPSTEGQPAVFLIGRHFQVQIIPFCVRWYLRYCVTLRDLQELMAERGLRVDHSTIGRWVLRYAPEL
jgi:transposase-like protein